ncbi:hypothetical protein CNMCM8927_008610 [Aspergillus lentulus]|uniref:Uncharacterized protein n=1 Tax=Aspergillus lentulus TaxID=293939 RepID=A0AAN5YNN2_ASPLE|nr:hypothetical protein CNMCM8927_008610 [Aspergillus lentulus]
MMSPWLSAILAGAALCFYVGWPWYTMWKRAKSLGLPVIGFLTDSWKDPSGSVTAGILLKRSIRKHMPNGTESIESIENGLQLCRNFPILTLEEWRNERLDLEMAAFKEAYETEPHADDLIPLLQELGFDVSPTPIRRYRIRISPSRATSAL